MQHVRLICEALQAVCDEVQLSCEAHQPVVQ
jgi:hypothetical protein